MLFTAVVLGTTGGVGIQTLNPHIRGDAFTGTEAREMFAYVENRLDTLEVGQALDDQHRIDAVEGYQRIRILETAISAQTQAAVDMREEIRLMREDVRSLLLRVIEVER